MYKPDKVNFILLLRPCATVHPTSARSYFFRTGFTIFILSARKLSISWGTTRNHAH